VTLFAVLELYKQGELTWSQDEPFGEITIASTREPVPTRLSA
jgi:segregation and condensation protein A